MKLRRDYTTLTCCHDYFTHRSLYRYRIAVVYLPKKKLSAENLAKKLALPYKLSFNKLFV
jgi:hypothetical protein